MRVRVAMIMGVAVAEAMRAIFLVVREHAHQHKIHDDADEGDPEHDNAVHWLRLDEAAHRLVDEDTCHDPHDHDRRERTQHLCAVVAKRVLSVGLATGEEERDDTYEEAA